jgi:hypothetical protein
MTASPVTPQHEALHRIFREDRELVARTMRHVFHRDVPVPRHVSILDTDFTEARPHMRRGDSVLLAEFLVEESEQRYVVLVEAQLAKDDDKERRWPYYIAYLHDKYECPVALLVVCNDPLVARWAREPITIGLPGVTDMTLTASILGPDNLGPITDSDEAAADVGLAVLAAITHSKSGQISDILEALADALDTVDMSTAEVLADLTMSGLNDTDGQKIWRMLMATATYPYATSLRESFREEGMRQGREQGREEGREEGRAQGLLEGQRDAVHQVIEARGFQLTDAQVNLINTRTDLDTLKAWSKAAVTAATVDDIFR